VKALVSGGAGGIGRAIVERLEGDVLVLDLADGHDVSDPEMWRRLDGEFDAACLNAGVATGASDVTAVDDARYRRVLGANVDGVFFGVRELAGRLMPRGGSIVVTASLAGLGPLPSDPVYALTKHAVIGLVRSAAPHLAERGIRINAVCPGMTDTPMLDGVRRDLEAAGFPLLSPAEIADAVVRALESEETGRAWVVQPGREPLVYEFRGIPGPRVPGAEGLAPPL
jgi:NAD(P)-dependent dehydrogenase (short-subunit alcohol dehydrogenase family)